MAASNEWWEWHLTPRGWERGSKRLDFHGTTHVPAPEDRVLTCTYYEYLGSMGGQGDLGTREDWRSKDEALVLRLLDEFGPCPRQ